jgi:hypothetical protein
VKNIENKTEQYKYAIERTQDGIITHLRMLSPDAGKTHVEYFSYIRDENEVFNIKIENAILQDMQNKLDHVLNNLDQNKMVSMVESAFQKDDERIARLREKIKRIENKKI